jgi:AcrR family transcriptional regulator
MSWTERAADRSPLVQQWRSRNVRQMKTMVDVAKRLIAEKGSGFTTQELARESGVALQTFYRHFGGKDQLLLATLEDLHAEMATRYEEAARDLPDPVARLHYYVKSALQALDLAGRGGMSAKFITAEHWRLYQAYPEDVVHATQPVVDLFARELRAAQEQGLLPPTDVAHSAELMVMLVRSVYHHYAFATAKEPTDVIIEHVWEFCLAAVGGRPGDGETATPPS